MRPVLAACLAATVLAGPTLAPAAAQQAGQRSWPIAGFDAVALTGSDDVDVRVGPAFSVRASGTPAVIERLRIERRNNVLEIGRDRRPGTVRGTARVTVTLPRLSAVAITGSGDLGVDRVAGAAFRGEVTGSGTITVGEVRAERTDIRLSGSGGVRMAGATRALGVRLSGSGDVDASRLTAGQASVTVGGSGGVRAAVNGPAEVNLAGSGDVDLGPRARCRVQRGGSGSVRCGG